MRRYYEAELKSFFSQESGLGADIPAYSDTLGTRESLVINERQIGNCQNCQCNRIVIETGDTVSGEVGICFNLVSKRILWLRDILQYLLYPSVIALVTLTREIHLL